MAFRDDLLAILTGGLPALGGGGGGGATTMPVEEVPPEPQLQDRESFLGFGGVTGQQVAIGGAALLGLVAVIFVARQL